MYACFQQKQAITEDSSQDGVSKPVLGVPPSLLVEVRLSTETISHLKMIVRKLANHATFLKCRVLERLRLKPGGGAKIGASAPNSIGVAHWQGATSTGSTQRMTAKPLQKGVDTPDHQAA
jgi:hypothetical protein